MRTSLVGGASRRRPGSAAGLVAAGALAVGLAALGAVPASASTLSATHPDRFDWKQYVAQHDRWDGGSGRTGDVHFTWPDRTVDYDGNVCPDMDAAKIDTTGDPLTVTLVAPEGKLISAYCIKSGSLNQGLGPKIVELDEPAAEVTIAYAAGGKCKAISHYSVAYVDAPPATTPPALLLPNPEVTTPTLDAPTPAPEPSEQEEPVVPATDEPSPEAAPSSSEEPSAAPGESASPLLVASPEASPSSSAEGFLAATDYAPHVEATGGRLALTGGEVTGFLVAAVVLVMLGSLAVHLSRSRRAGQG